MQNVGTSLNIYDASSDLYEWQWDGKRITEYLCNENSINVLAGKRNGFRSCSSAVRSKDVKNSQRKMDRYFVRVMSLSVDPRRPVGLGCDFLSKWWR